MDKNIKGLNPKQVWKHFSAICTIPHPSDSEDAIRNYLVAQAKEHGLECITDDAGNVIMRKSATPGMESRKGIILQAHMDMVPQKNGDKEFDFLTDPIEAYIDGEWVTANGTTLGADNGMGMAAILAIMESSDIVHGPLEALITATEETGMNGAFGLKAGLLQGDILLNLDSETEGELYVGCAGGVDANIEFNYTETKAPSSVTHRPMTLEVKGLLGGHSGIEIILGRGNANKILNRFLLASETHFHLHLASIDGGSLRNAIPREAKATVLIDVEKSQQFVDAVAAFESIIKTELKGVDDGVSFKVKDAPMPLTIIDSETQYRLLRAIEACPNGVMRMSSSMQGVVQTSTNLARVVSEGDKIKLQALLRSASNSEKEDLGTMFTSLFELAEADILLQGAYDGWNPNMDSPILKTMVESYEKLYGRKPAVTAIHAGLECGILGGAYPNLDMISFGPTICYPHSPDEKVNVASVERFWDYLLHTLANAPSK